ncbi:MAG: rhodanese-like domain-containing protein [Alphaproteobacteria bacterium]
MLVRLATFILFVFASASAMAGTIVTAPAAAKTAADGKTTIVDVRSPREWRQTGIAQGAAMVTIHNPNGIKAFVRAMAKAVGGDKTRPIALICAAGVRSARAARILAANGFTNIQNISEGMLGRPGAGPGWLKRGLPVSSP